MAIKSISIKGLRGYGIEQTINPAIPDKRNNGSGLTVIVGPNNSGKSTVLEAIDMVVRNNTMFKEDIRNKVVDCIKIEIRTQREEQEICHILESEEIGSAIGKKYYKVNGQFQEYLEGIDPEHPAIPIMIVPKDRGFNTYFNSGYSSKYDYLNSYSAEGYRPENRQNQNNIGGRLTNIASRDREKFDKELAKILDPVPNWRIDANSKGEKYLKFIFGKNSHSSNGAGDGFINIFTITSALYDLEQDEIVIIDEPEISLHPDQQRKLMDSLMEHSKDKQVIICTHSPYFINWNAINNGGKLIRLIKDNDGNIKTNELSKDSQEKVCKIYNENNNIQKPHNLGTNANEIFFLNDKVILTEGQEDVGCYKKLFQYCNFKTSASFFGWGIRWSR